LNPSFYCDSNTSIDKIISEDHEVFEKDIYEKLNDNYKVIEEKGD